MNNQKKATIKCVNNLVKKAFGKHFFGNHCPIIDELGADQIRGEKLERISKRTWLPLPWILETYISAGEFTAEDGSSLKVYPEYFSQAKKYAELYKQETGKNVSISKMSYSQDEIIAKIFNFDKFSLRKIMHSSKELNGSELSKRLVENDLNLPLQNITSYTWNGSGSKYNSVFINKKGNYYLKSRPCV